MKVEIFSDVVCPWCYIGKRKFEAALAEYRATDGADVEIDVIWRPYQLDPTAPVGSAQPVSDAYAKKFGGPERAAAIIDKVTGVAADVGIGFRMDRALRANTRDAHRLLGWAFEEYGSEVQSTLKENLLIAYFIDGRHVADVDTLVAIAAESGLDEAEARELLESDDGIAELNQELAEAASHGITAVPTFVFDEKWSIPGAQEPAMFLRAFRRMREMEIEQQEMQAAAPACDDEACEI